ncbi:LTA synthase family protein, partial [Bacteroidota bacterium]
MQSLKNRLLFNLKYFRNWVMFFIVSRFIFLGFYGTKTKELDLFTLLKIPVYGFKLDLAFSAYLAAIPFLLITISVLINNNFIKYILKIYTFAFICLMNLLLLFDLALYGPWGVRLDATPLTYINTPGEMLASVPTRELYLTIIAWLLISYLVSYLFNKTINKSFSNFNQKKIWNFPILLLITGSLVIVMRGGLQNTPINHSNVYFSDKMYANHAAINFAWNFANAVSSNSYDMNNPFKLMKLETAHKIIQEANQKINKEKPTSKFENILNTDKPNVILIIWESLTAKLVGSLGGEPNVTENLNQLSKEGLLFTNFYANGDRSDKGLVAILSGYYPQAHKSIIKSPSKTRTLPSLFKEMEKLGYNSSFYHGGDLSFGNMKTYLRSGGVNHFVDESDFDSKDHNSKWGAHDHVLFERFSKDLASKETKQPFFKSLFTLSSHEPFEFPDKYKFGKATKTDKFRSSHAYTDKTIGAFIKFAKTQSWWHNTLIVIMADHGHPMPKHKGAFNSPKKFHIPMLWLGGALN